MNKQQHGSFDYRSPGGSWLRRCASSAAAIFSARLPEDTDDEDNEVALLFNEVVGLNQQITEEFEMRALLVVLS